MIVIHLLTSFTGITFSNAGKSFILGDMAFPEMNVSKHLVAVEFKYAAMTLAFPSNCIKKRVRTVLFGASDYLSI